MIATDGLRQRRTRRRIARAQQLVASLGGTFHSVVGEDVSAAVVDFATGANATMIVVGVSRHGRLRRLFTGTTGDRIASLAGLDRRPPRHPRPGRAAGRCARPVPLAARRAPPGRRLGRSRCCCRSLLTWALHGFARHRPAPAGRARSSSPSTVAGRPGRRAAAGAGRGARRVPAAQLVLHPAGRHAHDLRADATCWPCWSSSPSRRRSPPSSTAPRAGPPRPPAPAPRRPRWARCPARC